MSSKNDDERLRRRELYLRSLNWTREDVDERMRWRDLVLRWVEEGRTLWQVQPDGAGVVGLREQLLELLDTICRNEDATERMLAGETATEAFAEADAVFLKRDKPTPTPKLEVIEGGKDDDA
jgi:hypothetical protein